MDGEETHDSLGCHFSLPKLTARQIAEHEFDGTCGVQELVSPLRSVGRASARSRFPIERRVAGDRH